MKKFNLLVLSFLLVAKVSFSQTGWFWQNPTPQGNPINCVQFINSSTGYAGTNQGTLLRTTNGGLNWVVWSSNIYNNTMQIHFFNINTGLAFGDSAVTSYIKLTTNGGLNWSTQKSIQYSYFRANFFTDSLTGICFAGTNLYKTTNGGLSWSIYGPGTNTVINCSFFTDQNTGYCGGNNSVFKTIDGGLNWSLQFIGNNSWSIQSIAFSPAGIGIASSSNGMILRTSNAGLTWEKITVSTSSNNLHGLYWLNANTCFLLGDQLNPNIFVSTNSGTNWSVQLSNINIPLNSISFSDQNTGNIVGNYGEILRTTNTGINWSNLSGGTICNITDMTFLNSLTGFACAGGTLSFDSQPKFLKTIDGGNHWQSTNLNSQNLMNAICFTDENHGTIVGQYLGGPYSLIFHTTNGGTNWTIQDPPFFSPVLRDVKFVDANTGWTVGTSYGIGVAVYKTTNGGINWLSQQTPTSYEMTKINVFDANNAVIAASGRVYKTSDGGANWIEHLIPSTDWLRCIFFINNNTGWVAGNKFFKTTDGGNNWILQFSTTDAMTSIFFLDAINGFATSLSQKLFYTQNGGDNWSSIYLPVYASMNKVYFTDQNTGWIAGGMAILKTTDAGILLGLLHSKTDYPNIYSLSQNYPNPFNPSTTIKFDIPPLKGVTGMIARLTIYDVLGREVTTLINKQLQPGSYSVVWDASNYPSGVYFYKLKADDFSESKKMLMVK